MKITKIGATSMAKVLGALYALFGFIGGVILAIASLLGSGVEGPGMFGVAAVVILPLVYGLIGILGGLVTAWLYNFVASKVGGIEMEVE